MPTRKERVEEALNKLVGAFASGEIIPKLAEIHRIKRHPGDNPPPSAKWSMANQILMLMEGTTDARGYKQWQEIGRHVKQGAKAIYILAPRMVRKDKLQTEQVERQTDDADNSEYFCAGFLAVPVFRLEDTEGEPLQHFDYTPPQPPPLADIAAAMDVPIEYIPASEHGPNGCYRHAGADDNGAIALMTYEHMTYLHEICHAAHDAIGLLKGRSRPQRETVAELSAAVLAELYGLRARHQHSAAYIQSHNGNDIGRACAQVLADCERVLDYIMDKAEALQPA